MTDLLVLWAAELAAAGALWGLLLLLTRRRAYTEAELLAHPVLGAQMRAADERWESGDRSTISSDEFRALIDEATS